MALIHNTYLQIQDGIRGSKVRQIFELYAIFGKITGFLL